MGKIKKLKFKGLPKHKKILWLVADNISDDDILFLSEHERGNDISKHAERITYFKQTLDTSKLEPWYPIEVWELNRWSSPGFLDTIGHRRRAFSCAGIWAYYSDSMGNSINESLDILLPLFESLVRLDLQDWQKHFSNFLLHSLTTITYPEDRFTVQLTIFLSLLSETTNPKLVRISYEQLLADEMYMLKYAWAHNLNETWDPALEPHAERPSKIVDADIIHRTAYMFSAKYVYLKAEQINDTSLSEDLKTFARRIARLGKGEITWLDERDIDDLSTNSIVYL